MTKPAEPLVSIVTPSFNQGQYIEQTIRSVLEQDYPRIEYIVVDGGSTDQTRAILERCGNNLVWTSEPDRGQTDAINKGFARAQGDILAWINSDDMYAPGAIRTVVDFFQSHPDVALVYGDVVAMDSTGKKYGRRTNVRMTSRDILIQEDDTIVQPAAFWRAELWQEMGPLDETLRYTMDYDFWIRSAQYYELRYLPVVLAYERLHGQTKTAGGNIGRLEEIEQVIRRHGGDGLPTKFHAEAAVTFTLAGFSQLRRGHVGPAKQFFARAWQYCHLSPIFLARFLLYAFAMSIMGQSGIPRLRLLASRLGRPPTLGASPRS